MKKVSYAIGCSSRSKNVQRSQPPHTEEIVVLRVLDPRGEIFTPPAKPIAARLKTLVGKKIGILSNTKPGADAFQPYLKKAPKEVTPNIEFKTSVISYNAYPGKERNVKALADRSDGVIGLLGD
jgi:hypothetical protein